MIPPAILALACAPGPARHGWGPAPAGDVQGVTAPAGLQIESRGGEVWFWLGWPQGTVDLLFVVDNSNSMREEQANLTSSFPVLAQDLLAEQDMDGDGIADGTAATSVHLGVISTDLGTGEHAMATCGPTGDDGILVRPAPGGFFGCADAYPAFLTYDGIEDPPMEDFFCLVTLGTGGCGWEQPLAAAERATTTQADGPNAGFLRPGADLVAVLVTDEDDCSVSDPSILADDEALGPLNTRCVTAPTKVRGVDTLAATLRNVTRRPEQFGIVVIAGVPPDLVEAPASSVAAFDAILADPRMIPRVDHSAIGAGQRIVPSCDQPGLGLAFPPARIVEFASEIVRGGGGALVQSICVPLDWAPMTTQVVRFVQERLASHTPGCLPWPRGMGGPRLRCALFETLVDDGPCGASRVDRSIGATGRRTCQICQLGERDEDTFGRSMTDCDGSGGWRYEPDDPACPEGGRTVFTENAEPATDSTAYLVCDWPPA